MMQIRSFSIEDHYAVVELWNREATKYDYKPFTEREFQDTFIDHPYFDADCIWVGCDEKGIVGFAAGCCGSDLPLGDVAGYITSVIIDSHVASLELYDAFLLRLEKRFQELGKRQADVLFFNPVKLKWSIPSAPQHEHNNAPGISKDQPLYEALMARGYEDRATQCGMYLKLGSFIVPEDILDKETNANSKDYYITSYVPDLHTGLEATLAALQNPQWKKDIVTYVKVGAPLVVAVYGNEVVGFAGPIISQPDGRAFFCGIGVHPEHEGHGLGSVLFFRMVEAFQNVGCQYISLFTGNNNPALRIYQKAGFTIEKQFSILRREL
ncbi:GNAT family N-acetyltransferase [Paenibacillus odorifer]|jgi:ribosomal protein S18 acetylase RimI-like enzyme|uniref:GNAT family N-acetyltransferase n=2 Tax=Paenibacillus odorifer TaxID=189426 RepID=A0A1R0WSU4_9BACL|nr:MULTISPECIES: GNAT family N-acetyltransferase [Paenibacillus]ETT46040.1 acetyltransferase [Paenibacillus sp. FSL H8-237]OMD20429.1 GNAT family N-acetyltransferase [Paenibacillus odorifer]OME63584.1 GNAT family N-acetyltransferase [Paenibacillus odorifer]